MNSYEEVFQKAVVSNFEFLKKAGNIQQAYLRAIEIKGIGFLVPICYQHLADKEIIEKLTSWRNEFVDAFPTQFKAEFDGTKQWLKEQVLDNHARILFLVVNKSGKAIGHLGFNNCINKECSFEIDNVVRGELCEERNIFGLALEQALKWARETVNVNKFWLRVFSENQHAIKFYLRNNFVEEGRIGLKKQVEKNLIKYIPAKKNEKVDKDFISMIWKAPSNDKTKMILTAGPSISAKEAVYSYDAALSGWNTDWSKYLKLFENNFASYLGVKYAISTSSCTGALEIALMASDIGPGDEVIVPDVTWVATAAAVKAVGATPVFADIEMDSWNICIKSAESLFSSRTKAIIPVHMYGHPARMDAIQLFAEQNGIRVIEDAAPAIGATWNGKKCGTFGDFAAFSFQGAKLLVTGEGGMLVTNDKYLYERAKKIWDQGRNPAKVFWIDSPGVKYKMSNIQAAIGLGQLERVDELIQMKRRIFGWYKKHLSTVAEVKLNEEVDKAKSIYWMSSIILQETSNISRDDLIAELKKVNVDSRPVFPAISQYPIWEPKQQSQPNALLLGQNGINLPSGVCLTENQVKYICDSIKEIL